MKKLIITLSILCTLVISQSSAASATETAEERKKAMFRTYMEQIGGLAEYNKILGMVKKQTLQVFQHVMQEKNKGGEKISQVQLDQAVANSIAGINQWIGKEMEQDEIIDNVFYPVHGSAYSEQDMKDILEFLNSDAGKKYTQQRNQLMRQSFQILSEMYIPRLQEELVKVVETEVDKLLTEK